MNTEPLSHEKLSNEAPGGSHQTRRVRAHGDRAIDRGPRRGRRTAAVSGAGLLLAVRLLHTRAPSLRACRVWADRGSARRAALAVRPWNARGRRADAHLALDA